MFSATFLLMYRRVTSQSGGGGGGGGGGVLGISCDGVDRVFFSLKFDSGIFLGRKIWEVFFWLRSSGNKTQSKEVFCIDLVYFYFFLMF